MVRKASHSFFELLSIRHVRRRMLVALATIFLSGGAVLRAGHGLSAESEDIRDMPLYLNGEPSREEAQTLFRSVEDIQGTYTIPYVQSQRFLEIFFRFSDPEVVRARVTLRRRDGIIAEREVKAPDFGVSFPDLLPAEYTLAINALDKSGQLLGQRTYQRIGVGDVLAAIGDSITEGYFGRGYRVEDLRLTADSFPTEAVSKDGRNFPQFAPTTHQHLPSVNCFEGFMTLLNDLLSTSWPSPLFIANEGWGGITSGQYWEHIRTDTNWQRRMKALRPNLWLIHLGVNDERAKVPPEQFAANMKALMDCLIREYGAVPSHIFLAKPCYDYFEGADVILAGYNREIDRLVAEQGLSAGPDFYAAYGKDKQRWYGDDPVHPNVEGMHRMAQLWHDSLVKRFPKGVE